jgi:hypothetical protein
MLSDLILIMITIEVRRRIISFLRFYFFLRCHFLIHFYGSRWDIRVELIV